ncbi:PepSY domain-containing protein [Pseudomonadota bacterium]|nr:PepSY domain-containing protein [Pseudomonadota bacterium]
MNSFIEMKLSIRNIHKYLSFFISLQLLLWTVSGIYFSFNKIELVRGEQYRLPSSFSLNLDQLKGTHENISNFDVINRVDQQILIISDPSGRKYLDTNGNPVSMLTVEQAKLTVKENSTLNPIDVFLIDQERNGSEYRGRELPLYQVLSLNKDQKSINVYVNPYSGKIVAIRSLQWKIWDLMWGFHIMDWQTRDNINNFLLKVFSILALISSVSGVLLFFRFRINP